MNPSETALADAPVADAADAAVENATPASLSPEQRAQQFQAFMAKIMGDMSRIRQQVDYTSRHFTGQLADVHGRLDHIEGVLAMLCDALHIEMPKRQPRLVDAKVELTAALEEGEVCEFRASYSTTAHPLFGHYQFLVGADDNVQAAQAKQFHPLVIQRIDEAFTALRATEGFVDGAFYFVRLSLLHAEPIDASSVPVQIGDVEAPAAANDDAEPAVETAHVEHE